MTTIRHCTSRYLSNVVTNSFHRIFYALQSICVVGESHMSIVRVESCFTFYYDNTSYYVIEINSMCISVTKLCLKLRRVIGADAKLLPRRLALHKGNNPQQLILRLPQSAYCVNGTR